MVANDGGGGGGNNGGGDAFSDVLLVSCFLLNVLHGLCALCVTHGLPSFRIALGLPNFCIIPGLHVTSSPSCSLHNLPSVRTS